MACVCPPRYLNCHNGAMCPVCNRPPAGEVGEALQAQMQSQLDAENRIVELGPLVCSWCHKPATMKCAGCQLFESNTIDVYYCNAACQQKDWPRHKEICKDRYALRSLRRTARLAQEIMFMTRTVLHHVNYSRIQSTPLMETGYAAVPVIGYIIAHDAGSCERVISYPFPEHLFKDQDIKEAVLALDASFEAITCLFPIWHFFLSKIDMILKPYEVALELKKFRRPCRVVTYEEPVGFHTDTHEVFYVILKNNKGYVLDICGPAFGFNRPGDLVTPSRLYYTERGIVCSESTVYGFGSAWAFAQRKTAKPALNRSGRARVLHCIKMSFCDAMDDAMRVWLQKHMTAKQLLKANDEVWRQNKTLIVQVCKEAIEGKLNAMCNPTGLLRRRKNGELVMRHGAWLWPYQRLIIPVGLSTKRMEKLIAQEKNPDIKGLKNVFGDVQEEIAVARLSNSSALLATVDKEYLDVAAEHLTKTEGRIWPFSY